MKSISFLKHRSLLISATAVSLLVSGCATGRTRECRNTNSDRIPAKQSSYRIRGSDETGTLTDLQKQKLRLRTKAWRWPTNSVQVTSRFGTRSGNHHDGIDLRANTGTPVSAAGDGRVIYSGNKIRGYGKMVVIRHEGRLSTIYAHNSKLYVKNGQNVRRGQAIALSGNTGHSSGPHLHFEVRDGVTAIDPMLLLPSPAAANEATRRMASSSRSESRSEKLVAPKSRGRKRRPERYTQSSARRGNSRVKQKNVAARVTTDDGFQPRSPRTKIQRIN
jgi:hypothetical protein